MITTGGGSHAFIRVNRPGRAQAIQVGHAPVHQHDVVAFTAQERTVDLGHRVLAARGKVRAAIRARRRFARATRRRPGCRRRRGCVAAGRSSSGSSVTAALSSTSSSISNQKRLPTPSRLSTCRSPPIDATSRLQMTSPSPEPPKAACGRRFGLIEAFEDAHQLIAPMPMPLSVTEMRRRARAPCAPSLRSPPRPGRSA